MNVYEAAEKSIREFAKTIERVIRDDSRRLANTFASRHGSHVKEIAWGQHDDGEWSVYIDLMDGHRLQGRGDGKLDALAEAERTLGL